MWTTTTDGPDICVDVPPGDTLHRVAVCTAAGICVDAGMGRKPPALLLVWAFSIFRCLNRVPEA